MKYKIKHLYHKFSDIIISDLTYGLFNAVKWFYRLCIRRRIASFRIENTMGNVTKRAYLYQHGHFPKDHKHKGAILVLHGLYGNPSSMLQLIDTAQKAGAGSVFSMFLSYDRKNPEMHRALLLQAIDQIGLITQNQANVPNSITLVGHSQGAIESAYRLFVEKDKRIRAVISIAGRLRVVPSPDKGCRPLMKSTVETVFRAINEYPEYPLYQIVAADDWNAPTEATLVRPIEGFYHVVKDAKHLNIIYNNITLTKLTEYLKKSTL